MLYWATFFLFFFFNWGVRGEEEEFRMYKGWKVFLCDSKLVQEIFNHIYCNAFFFFCLFFALFLPFFCLFVLFCFLMATDHMNEFWGVFQHGSSFPTARGTCEPREGGWVHCRWCWFPEGAFHWGFGFCLLCLIYLRSHSFTGRETNKNNYALINFKYETGLTLWIKLIWHCIRHLDKMS